MEGEEGRRERKKGEAGEGEARRKDEGEAKTETEKRRRRAGGRESRQRKWIPMEIEVILDVARAEKTPEDDNQGHKVCSGM